MATQTAPDPRRRGKPMPPPDKEPLLHSQCSVKFSPKERLKLLLGGELDVILVYRFADMPSRRGGRYEWVFSARWPWEKKPKVSMFGW